MLKRIRNAVLPKEIADRLNAAAGDYVFAVETADGILLTSCDDTTARAMQAAQEGAHRYRNALRRLAG